MDFVSKISWNIFALGVLVCSAGFWAQKGTAPNGYYPSNYSGATFTGAIQSAVPEHEEITLVYTKGDKSEIFVGRMESPCSWEDKKGTIHTINVSEIPKGTVLTAFYETVTKKIDDRKVKVNSIIAISTKELDGQKIPDEKRVIIPCTENVQRLFKAF